MQILSASERMNLHAALYTNTPVMGELKVGWSLGHSRRSDRDLTVMKPVEGDELIRSGKSKQGNASEANLEGLTDALNLEQRRLFSASKNRVQHEEVVEGRCSQKT